MQTAGVELVSHCDELPYPRVRCRLPCAAGLVIIDEQKGFATVGGGALAPAEPNAQIARMIAETDRLSRSFVDRGLPIAVFLDYHQPDRPEPPYPPHCIAGSGEEDLVPELQWLVDSPRVTLMRADCINDFVGAIDLETGRNQIVEWVNDQLLDTIVVVGICTDICVAEFVSTMLSARNHRMMPELNDVVVYEPGCATYDLPRQGHLLGPAGHGGAPARTRASLGALPDGLARRLPRFADHMNAVRFFFYGTLIDPEILDAVLRRAVHPARRRNAVLRGYRRVYREGASYPSPSPTRHPTSKELSSPRSPHGTIRPAHGIRVPLEYELRELPVRLSGDGFVRAKVFLPRTACEASRVPWTLEEWQRRYRRTVVRRLLRHRRTASAE